MKKNRKLLVAAVAALSTISFAACSSEGPSSSSSSASGSALSGTLTASGATSQQAAESAWIASFTSIQPDVRVSYSGGGSGKGRSDFKSGASAFAGSDAALSDDDMQAGNFEGCADTSNALNLPIYISPIAIIFNVEGVDELNLDAATTAAIFSGSITSWDDPQITALNPDANLPSTQITVVHRSDQSGTTENFTDTLHQTAPDAWPDEGSQTWPESYSGESAEGTAGVVSAVQNGTGTIGYADESQTSGMTTVNYGNDGDFVGPTAEAAAEVVAASDTVSGRPDNDLSLELDRNAAGYPFVLVSYALVCEEYSDSNTAEMVKAYLGYVASDEGQQVAQEQAGSAPLSSSLASRVQDSIDSIK